MNDDKAIDYYMQQLEASVIKDFENGRTIQWLADTYNASPETIKRILEERKPS